MKPALVSILVRSMNRATLDRALASIALQTYEPIEVVVVAACGPGHRDLPLRCGKHAMFLVRPPMPLPRAKACNAALDAARGDWLNFLDDDDELLPGHVEILRGAADLNPECRLIHSQSAMLASDGTTSVYGSSFQAWRQLDGGCFQFAGALFARSLLAEGLRADERFDILEDLDFFVQAAQRTRFAFVPLVTSRHYRGSGTSGTGDGENADSERLKAAVARLHAKWADLKKTLDALAPSRIARAQAYLRHGQDAQALNLLRPLASELPDDVNVLNLCGLAELRVGDPEVARNLIHRALELVPGHAGLVKNLELAEAAIAARHRSQS